MDLFPQCEIRTGTVITIYLFIWRILSRNNSFRTPIKSVWIRLFHTHTIWISLLQIQQRRCLILYFVIISVIVFFNKWFLSTTTSTEIRKDIIHRGHVHCRWFSRMFVTWSGFLHNTGFFKSRIKLCRRVKNEAVL